MKKLVYVFLLVSTLSQASSIIHKSMNHLDPESKAVFAHAISGLKNVEMEKLTSDYWNFLKTQEGDSDLRFLITDKTLEKGNRNFGLLAEDVKQIQDRCLCKISHNQETFVYSALIQLLKEKNIHLGLFSYVMQQNHEKSETVSLSDQSKNIEDLVAVIKKELKNYVLVDQIDLSQSKKLEYTHIVIPVKNLSHNDKVKNNLKKYLSDNPEGKVVLAFEDTISIGNFAHVSSYVKKLIVSGKSLRKAGNYFFYYSKSLKELELPNELEEVGSNFLSGCSSLEKLKIRGLKKVGDNFLYNCCNLKYLELSDELEEVGSNFLSGCSSLEILKISGLKKIEDNFLYGCGNLKYLELTDELEEVGDKFLFECRGLEKLKIRGLKKVGNSFLNSCCSLKELELLDELEEVERYFLKGCKSLEKLKIRGLKKIGDFFLHGCHNLKELELSDDLEEVGNYFLEDCKSLEKLIITEALYDKLKKENKLLYIPKNIKIILKNCREKDSDGFCVIQ